MLNLYVIYISSMESGDVVTYDQLYNSHGKAQNGIDKAIQQYAQDRKSSFVIKLKDEFDTKELVKDDSISVGTYCFKRKQSSACIYQKVLVEGRLWNGSKLVKVGKIGILPEISIPANILKQHVPSVPSVSSVSVISNKSDVTKELSEEDFVLTTRTKDPTNYEHGQHVSFIQELKNSLTKRRESILGKIDKNDIEMNAPTPEHQQFISSLQLAKTILTHVTPPPSPELGRVIETKMESDFRFFGSESMADEFSWDESSEILMDSDEEKELDDLIIDLLDSLDRMAQPDNNELNTSDFSSSLSNSEETNEEYGTDGYEAEEYETDEWEIMEYYENHINSEPIRRKYLDVGRFKYSL